MFTMRMFTMRDVEKLFSLFKPQNLTIKTVVQGAAHQHKFVEAPWDHARLGPSTTDFDEDEDCPDVHFYGSEKPVKFPMCTFKTFYRCACGEEKISFVSALI
ncbi:MAG: hypothetical protein Q8R36_05765 [bacterium]|nr:hypothetical protein [bacterium]